EPRIFWQAQLFKIYWYAHREELPDNECYACVVADTVLLKYAILDWRWVVVFILPALAGLLLAWARARRVASDELFLVLYAIGLAVTVLTFYVSSRYRIGHVPVWIVLVAVGLDRGIALVGRASGGWRRPATWLLLGLLLLPGVWMAGKPLPRYSPDLWTVRVVLLYLD